jgi:D-3-phosphoglycerate dehydrogenase
MTQETVVVTAASIHADAVQMLGNYKVVFADVRAGEDALAELCQKEQPVGIMVRYGNISAKVISASKKLRIIAKHGVGTDNIDKQAAAALGIPVTAALGSNSQAVAEHTLGLMFACARMTSWLDARMRVGHWDKDNYLGIELAGATLGLIGAGSIGKRVAQVALALGMRVLIHDPYATKDSLPDGVELSDLEPLIRSSNVVSLHCPLNPDTRNLLDARRLAMLPDQCIVINTARAGLFDESALLHELHNGRLHAGIDCFQDEPLGNESPWLTAPNAILTPHIGGTTAMAFRQMGVMAAQSILAHLEPVAA